MGVRGVPPHTFRQNDAHDALIMGQRIVRRWSLRTALQLGFRAIVKSTDCRYIRALTFGPLKQPPSLLSGAQATLPCKPFSTPPVWLCRSVWCPLRYRRLAGCMLLCKNTLPQPAQLNATSVVGSGWAFKNGEGAR